MKSNSGLPVKFLFTIAMETELLHLLKKIRAVKVGKLLNTFPLYKASYKSFELFVVETFVGELNASVAGCKAIEEVNPDWVIKFGAVGGSYPESQSGDIIVPLGYFQRSGWITRNKKTHVPTADASTWDSVFGEKDYQIQESRNNLGGMPYYFPVRACDIEVCKRTLKSLNLKFQTAHVGGGNMWMFDQSVLHNVGKSMLPKNTKHKRFVSDMESYALAHICYLAKKPFIGCYLVASNDYLDEEYKTLKVAGQMKSLVPYSLSLVEVLGKS